MSSPARLRDRRALQAQITALRLRSGGDGDTTAFRRGAMDALQWITEGGPAPLTGCQEGWPASAMAIVRELAAAEAFIYGRPSRHRAYCEGLEHALMWAPFATQAAPAGTAAPPVAPHLDLTDPRVVAFVLRCPWNKGCSNYFLPHLAN